MAPFSKPNGGGGSAFDAGRNLAGVQKIILYIKHEGKYLGGIEFEYKDGTKTPLYGKSNGEKHTFEVNPLDHIVKIRLRTGWGVDAIQFVTEKGNESPMLGGDGGGKSTLVAPKGQKLVGFKGRHGSLIDKFEPVWGNVDFVQTVKLDLQLVLHIDGGSKGSYKKTVKVTKGHSSTSSTSSNVTTIAAEASYEISKCFLSGKAGFDSKYKSHFEAATQNTYASEEHNETIYVDLSKPCYYYIAKVSAMTKKGETHHFSNDAIIQSDKPLVKVQSWFGW